MTETAANEALRTAVVAIKQLVREARATTLPFPHVQIGKSTLSVAKEDLYRPKLSELVQTLDEFDLKEANLRTTKWDAEGISRLTDALSKVFYALVEAYAENNGKCFATTWLERVYALPALVDVPVLCRATQRYVSIRSNSVERRFRSLAARMGHSNATWSFGFNEDSGLIVLTPRVEIAGEVLESRPLSMRVLSTLVKTIRDQCAWTTSQRHAVNAVFEDMYVTVSGERKRLKRDTAEATRQPADSKRTLKPLSRGKQALLRIELLDKLKTQFSATELALLVHQPLRPEEFPALVA